VHDNGDILTVRTQLTIILSIFVFPSWLKFFLIREENYLVWIRWFSSGAQGLSIAGRVAYSADMFLKIKKVCLHVVIPGMHSFSMGPSKYF
jgi:hypothetical protein